MLLGDAIETIYGQDKLSSFLFAPVLFKTKGERSDTAAQISDFGAKP